MSQADQGLDILQRAASWMHARGWRRKLAKRRGYEQSLFEHSLNELDVLLRLLPILKGSRHFGFSEEESQVLCVSVVAHDAAKETTSWQSYVRGDGPWVSHVDAELTRRIVPEICQNLGFHDLREAAQRVIENCVNLHMKSERGDAAIVTALFQGSGRWRTLAEVVITIDHFCSAATLLEARRALEAGLLGRHLSVTYHLVNFRGVSTTLLHRAAVDSFTDMNWHALLHFNHGTLYAAPAESTLPVPTTQEISKRLADSLGQALNKRDMATLIVGSPTGNILPKPDLIDFAQARSYLEAAVRKVGARKFLGDYEREKQRTARAESLARGRSKLKADVIQDYWKLTGRSGHLYSSEMDRDADRIARGHPEMIVFKFFKAMMREELVGKKGQALACQHYEAIFSSGSWAELQTTASLMAAQDMAKTVDRFWSLPGSRFDLPYDRIEEMPDQERQALLIKVLDENIVQKVYAAIQDLHPSPLSKLAEGMASAFIADLVFPAEKGDVVDLARQQLKAYGESKPFAGKQPRKAIYLCPICNSPFDNTAAIKGAADFIEKPESHTNRAISHGPFDYVTICKSCYYDRILMHSLLGIRPEEILVLFPRVSIGHGNGWVLVDKVKRWIAGAQEIVMGNINQGMTLGLTSYIASRLGSQDISGFAPEDLVQIMSYATSDQARKKQLREAEKLLRERYEGGLGELNDVLETDFTDWDAAAKAVLEGAVGGHEANSIRRNILRRQPVAHFVCETPNVIFVPLSYPIVANDKESEANRAIRQLFVALLISLVFDVMVAVRKSRESLDLAGGKGAAYVPAVPAVRQLIGSEWVSLLDAEKWLWAIGAASLLARDAYTDKTGQKENPSSIFLVLNEDPPERLLRRLEQQLREKNRQLRPDHFSGIEVLQEVRR